MAERSTSTTTSTTKASKASRRYRIVALVLPAGIVLAAAAVQVALWPRVPDPVAVHWDVHGTADGFAPAWTTTVLLLGGLAVALLLGGIARAGIARGGHGSTYRALGALAPALAAYLSVLTTWLLAIQVGLPDAVAAQAGWQVAVAAALVALGVGFSAWVVLPSPGPGPATSVPVPALDLARDERVVWVRTATIGRALPVLLLTVSGVAVLAVAVWIVGPAPAAGVLTALALLLGIAAATATAFVVRVDDRGLSVRSLARIPRFTVPLAQVADATVVDVDPIGDFGGYGLRSRPRRFGVVLRRGAALSVRRTNGHEFVVTVDDAATAAGLLLALRDRSAAAG